MEEKDGYGLSESNNNADGIFIQKEKLLLLLPCGDIKVVQSTTESQILL
jgi:hypothetical protein